MAIEGIFLQVGWNAVGILQMQWPDYKPAYYAYQCNILKSEPEKWDGQGIIFFARDLVGRNLAQQLNEHTIEMQGVRFQIIGFDMLLDCYVVKLKKRAT